MKKVIGLILVLVVIGSIFTGCEVTDTVDEKQSQQQEQMLKDMNNQIGLPDIEEWSEKKMAKEIIELRDNSKLITYAYLQNINGKFVYLGQCVGFGLPYSVQYTNPQVIVDRYEGDVAIPQADPNGLFMPEGLSATWIQYINPETGNREIIYCEPNVVITQSKFPKRLLEEWSIPTNY